KPRLQIAAVGQERGESRRGIVVDACASGVVEIECGAFEVLAMEKNSRVMSAEIDVLESFENLRGVGSHEGATRHLEVESRINAPVLLDAVVIQIPQQADVRTHRENTFSFGAEAAHQELLSLTHVDPRDIAQLGVKALAPVNEIYVIEPFAASVKQVKVVS